MTYHQRFKSPEERFEEKVSPCPLTGCWWWLGGCDSKGYGAFRSHGRQTGAHRVAYELFRGPLAPYSQVNHSCGNGHLGCVAPGHLYLGSQRDNMQDRLRDGRHHCAAKTHCKNGHPFNEENTYRPSRGGRMCKTCGADAKRRRYAQATCPKGQERVSVAVQAVLGGKP